MFISSSKWFCFQYFPGIQICRDFHVSRANAIYYPNGRHIRSEALFTVILPWIILPNKEYPVYLCQKIVMDLG